MDKEKCFAYRYSPRGWACSALTVNKCEFPNCRTFKTKRQVIEQKRACLEKIRSYPKSKQNYITMKYGEYIIEDWNIDE